MTGGSLSVITTLMLHTAELPAASIAVQVTVEVPTGNVAPAKELELL